MADTESTKPADEHLMKPFQWHKPELEFFPGIRFAGQTLDMALGISCVLEILHKNDMEREFGAPPLNQNQEGRLMRLAIAASHALAEYSEGHLEWAEKHGFEACRDFSVRHGRQDNRAVKNTA